MQSTELANSLARDLIHGDEAPSNIPVADINQGLFASFYEQEYGELLSDQDQPIAQLLNNLNLAKDDMLNVAGALLFANGVRYRLPAFMVKCVSYPGLDVDTDEYGESQDATGTLKLVFDDVLAFVLRYIRRVQAEQGVNSLGELEVPKIVFEELIVNALIHRDYFVSAATN